MCESPKTVARCDCSRPTVSIEDQPDRPTEWFPDHVELPAEYQSDYATVAEIGDGQNADEGSSGGASFQGISYGRKLKRRIISSAQNI